MFRWVCCLGVIMGSSIIEEEYGEERLFFLWCLGSKLRRNGGDRVLGKR